MSLVKTILTKIKFNNGSQPALNDTNLNQMQTNIQTAISSLETNIDVEIGKIIESGSNSNGNYIKFSDGTMICTKSVIVSTKIENPWGNLFESSQLDLGNFPVSFIETPVLSVNKTIGRGSWLELVEGTTNSAIGNTYLVSAVSTTSTTNITINIIAIGKWK